MCLLIYLLLFFPCAVSAFSYPVLLGLLLSESPFPNNFILSFLTLLYNNLLFFRLLYFPNRLVPHCHLVTTEPPLSFLLEISSFPYSKVENTFLSVKNRINALMD